MKTLAKTLTASTTPAAIFAGIHRRQVELSDKCRTQDDRLDYALADPADLDDFVFIRAFMGAVVNPFALMTRAVSNADWIDYADLQQARADVGLVDSAHSPAHNCGRALGLAVIHGHPDGRVAGVDVYRDILPVEVQFGTSERKAA